MEQLVDDLPQDEHAEYPHDRCLRHGGPRFPDWASRDHVKTETVNKGVAQHVEGVGEQGHGPSEQTRHELHKKHAAFTKRTMRRVVDWRSRSLSMAQVLSMQQSSMVSITPNAL